MAEPQEGNEKDDLFLLFNAKANMQDREERRAEKRETGTNKARAERGAPGWASGSRPQGN